MERSRQSAMNNKLPLSMSHRTGAKSLATVIVQSSIETSPDARNNSGAAKDKMSVTLNKKFISPT